MTENFFNVTTRRIMKTQIKRVLNYEQDYINTQNLIGQKDRLIEEREEWIDEIKDLEKLLLKKLCITQPKLDDYSNSNRNIQIFEKYSLNHEHLNSSFTDDLPIFAQVPADDVSFGQADSQIPQIFLNNTEGSNSFNLDRSDRHEVTFNPQNHTNECDNLYSFGNIAKRKLTRSFNTMKPIQQKIYKVKKTKYKKQNLLK